MNRKRNNILSCLALLNVFNLAGGPALAVTQQDILNVAEAENQVKDSLKRGGQRDALYQRSVMNLARAYYRAGRRQDAEKNVQYLVKLYDAIKCSQQACDTMCEWADFITSGENGHSPTSQDIAQAKRITEDALEKSRNLDPAARMDVIAKTTSVNKKLSRSNWANLLGQERNQPIFALESYQNLGEREIERKARDLDRQAIEYSNLALDGMGPNQNLTSEGTKYFHQAEQNRQRAMDLYNRLVAANSARISAQRQMYYFYLQFKEPAKAEAEKGKLARLLNSNDEDVLFPKRICTGCGRG